MATWRRFLRSVISARPVKVQVLLDCKCSDCFLQPWAHVARCMSRHHHELKCGPGILQRRFRISNALQSRGVLCRDNPASADTGASWHTQGSVEQLVSSCRRFRSFPLTLVDSAAELLSGEREGVFAFDKSAKITTKTADGVVRYGRRMVCTKSHPVTTQLRQFHSRGRCRLSCLYDSIIR